MMMMLICDMISSGPSDTGGASGTFDDVELHVNQEIGNVENIITSDVLDSAGFKQYIARKRKIDEHRKEL